MSVANRAAVWWRALRYHYVSPSIFPAALGGLVSWANGTGLSLPLFALVLAAVVVNHVGLNMTDDYFDYRYSVDRLAPGERNPYTGGSGTLSAGLISPGGMARAFSICYAVTAALGFYLTALRGPFVLAFGCVGLFCSFFYTAKPFSMASRGLGELSMLLNFGTTIGLGSFFVQSGVLTWEAFWATLPLGVMLFSMMVVNEIPDFMEDQAAGKLTLVARLGVRAGVRVYAVSWVANYAVIIGSVALGVLPPFCLAALASAPLVIRSLRVLGTYEGDGVAMAPANLDMLRAHAVTGLCLIGGYSAWGLSRGAEPVALVGALMITATFYLPNAIALVRVGR